MSRLSEMQPANERMVAVMRRLSESVNGPDCANDTPEQWRDTYEQVTGLLLGTPVAPLAIDYIRVVTDEGGTHEQRTKSLIAHMLQHYEQQGAMMNEIGRMMGQFGIEEIVWEDDNEGEET